MRQLVCAMGSALTLVVVGATTVVGADFQAPAETWQLLDHTPAAVMSGPALVRPPVYAPVRLNLSAMQNKLSAAPLEGTAQAEAAPLMLSLPMPDGSFSRFEVIESPIMEPGLAAQFPEIRTYRGWGLDDRSASVRLDLTPAGFHAQVLSPSGAVYVDPLTRDNVIDYASYYKRDYMRPGQGFECETPESYELVRDDEEGGDPRTANGATLRTYRLACAATGEYTTFHGGSVALGQAAVVTAINRVTGVYETELCIRLVLVANNSLLIYTNSGTDPYTNGNASLMGDQNQTTCDNIILNQNYDIGHVFGTSGGGSAELGVVGIFGEKARGASAIASPVGDPFTVDYVCHEIGHQFGANHIFNGVAGSCAGGNRNASTAYEPGSGSTIMSYSGICGTDNLQVLSDPYFHHASLDEIVFFITSSIPGVGTQTSTGNAIPTANAGADHAIPKGTPFTLTASASDANGDTLSYCWEERDLGAAQALSAPDNGSSPICRTWNALLSPSRTVPRLQELLTNTVPLGEKIPAVDRVAMNWRVVVRDNRAQGAFRTDDMVVRVAGGSGPFLVTSPNTAVTWSGIQTVTWDVAGSTDFPVECFNVKISLSTDGGNTFPTVLLNSTTNDGSASVTLPSLSTSQARIKIEGVGNIFFDISNTDFTIVPGVPNFVDSGLRIVGDPACIGNGNGTNQLDPGEFDDTLFLGVRNDSTTNATGVFATLASLTPTASVVSGFTSYPNLPAGTSGTNDTNFVISIAPEHVCGASVNLRLTVNSNEGSNTVDYSLSTGCTPPHTPCPGDMNLDHVQDGNDIPLFVACVMNVGTNCYCGDFNFSGTATPEDAADFANALLDGTPCP